MDWLFAWNHFVFVVPITVGMMLALGTAFGLHGDAAHGGHGGHDTHAGHAAHSGHAHLSLSERVGAFFGFGRAPMAVLLMLMFFAFGVPGLGVDMLLEHVPGHGAIAVACGVAGFLVLTPTLSRVLLRMVPQAETEVISIESLVGSLAIAEFDTGAAEVCHALAKDGRGARREIDVKVGEPVKKGDMIFLSAYDSDVKQFNGIPAEKQS